jgi:Phosphotransferase enzyme family
VRQMVSSAIDIENHDFDQQLAGIVAGHYGTPVGQLVRGDNEYQSRNMSGTAKCVLRNDDTVLIFWKIGSAQSLEQSLSVGCVGNELLAYEHLQFAMNTFAPQFVGGTVVAEEALLVIEFMEGMYRVQKSPYPGSLRRAAHQLGIFHGSKDSIAGAENLPRYDSDFYSTWVDRACRNFPQVSWLRQIGMVFPSLTVELGSDFECFIHGELYPDNLLVSPDQAVAVDWEWAGVGLGEIDLAALTEGWWGDDVKEACTRAYLEGRGGNGENAAWKLRLAMARLYLHLRWLGARSRSSASWQTEWRLSESESLAREVGLLPTRT